MKEVNIGEAATITSHYPLVLVCTMTEDGVLNLAPISLAVL